MIKKVYENKVHKGYETKLEPSWPKSKQNMYFLNPLDRVFIALFYIVSTRRR